MEAIAPDVAAGLRHAVQKAKDKRRVVQRLRQLEVEGGSTKNLHDKVVVDGLSEEYIEADASKEEMKELQKLNGIHGWPGVSKTNINRANDACHARVRRSAYTSIKIQRIKW